MDLEKKRSVFMNEVRIANYTLIATLLLLIISFYTTMQSVTNVSIDRNNVTTASVLRF